MHSNTWLLLYVLGNFTLPPLGTISSDCHFKEKNHCYANYRKQKTNILREELTWLTPLIISLTMNSKKAKLPESAGESEKVKNNGANNPALMEICPLLFMLHYTTASNSFLICVFNLQFCVGFPQSNYSKLCFTFSLKKVYILVIAFL